MMTEPMTGLYALTVLAAFIFFSWEERRDVENADDADFILVRDDCRVLACTGGGMCCCVHD